MATKVVGARQLRDRLAAIIEEVNQLEEIVITQRGEGRAVLVGLERYNHLLDRLAYLEDSIDAIEAEREGAVPLERVA